MYVKLSRINCDDTRGRMSSIICMYRNFPEMKSMEKGPLTLYYIAPLQVSYIGKNERMKGTIIYSNIRICMLN